MKSITYKITTIIFIYTSFMGFTILKASSNDIQKLRAIKSDYIGQVSDDPAVKKLITECQNEISSAIQAKKQPIPDLNTCVTDKLGYLPENEQNRILKQYFDNNTAQQGKYESQEISTISTGADPAIKKLEDYLSKRLEQAMYGDIKSNKDPASPIKVVDHDVFASLYKTQITKNIISSVSSYCIDARHDYKYLIFKNPIERKKTTNRNLQSLRTFRPETKTPDAYNNWNYCIGSLQHICHADINTKINPPVDYDTMKNDPNFSYSKRRACEVVQYLRGLKQNLIEATAIELAYKNKAKKRRTRQISGINAKVYVGKKNNKDEKNIDDLTSITSNEFISKTGYSQANIARQKELDNCLQSKSQAECQKFLISGQKSKDLKGAALEYSIRAKIFEKKIDNIKTKDQVIKYLKDEGRDQAEIEATINNYGNIDLLKNKIKENYKQERAEIVNNLNNQLRKVTTKKETFDFNQDAGTLNELNQELKSRTDEYKELIHYNNLVAGYLTLTDSSGKASGNNMQSLFRELKDNAYEKSPVNNSQPNTTAVNAYGSGDDINELKKQMQGGEAPSGEDSASLDTKTINQSILDYSPPKSVSPATRK